jgi:hypothetical protein
MCEIVCWRRKHMLQIESWNWTKHWRNLYENDTKRRIQQALCKNKIWYDLKDHNMAPKQWISIRNIIIYLETTFCTNRRIFVFWRPFWIQDGRHRVQHVLLPVNIHFHWNLFIFEILTIYFNFFSFYIGGHFEMAAILKIKKKSTTLSDDLYLCQVSNGSAVRFPFNIFCTLVTMATAAILNLFNRPKAATH